MKKINEKIYEQLTPQERIIASIEAVARDDEQEKQRLIKTCPKKSYTQTDAEYSDKIERLFDIALCVECELRGYAIDYMLNQLCGNSKKLKNDFSLKNIININTAWEAFLEKQGIDKKSMDNVKSKKHYALKYIIDKNHNLFEPDINEILNEMIDYYQ